MAQLKCLSTPAPAANGLGVIGGDTVNFVGLGGCKPERKSLLIDHLLWSYVERKSADLWIHYVDFAEDLPNYCTGGVLRSPTMWLGIFTGGCALMLPFSCNHGHLSTKQHIHSDPNDVPRARRHSPWHPPYLHRLLAAPDRRHILPAHAHWRCPVRLFQESCDIPQVGESWKRY